MNATFDPLQDAVKTVCNHYFHEQCALRHNTKTGKCFLCEKPTRGIFNMANEIIRKVKRKKAKEEAAAAAAGAGGG